MQAVRSNFELDITPAENQCEGPLGTSAAEAVT